MNLMPHPHLVGLPVLETERLVLRAPEPADWPVFRDFSLSDRTAFVAGGKTEADAFQKFAGMIGQWPLRGFGRFVLTSRVGGEPLGHVGPLQLLDGVVPELTWSLWSAAATGKGYALEAAQAVNRWLFGTLEWAEARAEVHADNHASHALARNLGGRQLPDVPTTWFDGGSVYRFDRTCLA